MEQSYSRDNRLVSDWIPIPSEVRHLDVGSSHPGTEEGSKGAAVLCLRGYVSWVYTVAIQVGSYLLKDIEYRAQGLSTRGLGLLYQWFWLDALRHLG